MKHYDLKVDSKNGLSEDFFILIEKHHQTMLDSLP